MFLGISFFVLGHIGLAQSSAPYSSTNEKVYVGGYVCAGSQYAQIYYPTVKAGGKAPPSKTPLISFAHGVTAGGVMMAADYARLLPGVASWGYVVIALESAPLRYCIDETKDQIWSLAWIKTSRFAEKVDWDKPTGVMGHSMGGQATHLTAANAAAVDTHNIAAAVALHPVYVLGSSRIPIFYGSGSWDIIVPPGTVKAAYEQTYGVAKIFAEIRGASHFEPNTVGPNRWTDFAAAMFGCHIYRIDDACATVYGNKRHAGDCSLCTCGPLLPMAACTHAHEPMAANITIIARGAERSPEVVV